MTDAELRDKIVETIAFGRADGNTAGVVGDEIMQLIKARDAAKELDGKIAATKYAMQFAEKDPEYVTWDFLDGMLSSYEAERRESDKEEKHNG